MTAFETAHYELSHGRSPRGRGSWAFCPFHKRNASDAMDFTIWSPGGMTFTEARKWAKGKIADLHSTAPAGSPYLALVWTVMP